MVASPIKAETLALDGFSEDANDIANGSLSRTGAALMSSDFEAFFACFALPHQIETFDGIHTATTRDDLETVFIGLRRYLVGKSVTEIVRHCVSAQFDGPDVVTFSHETRLMNGNCLVQEPFPSLSKMTRIDGHWLLTSSSCAVVNAPYVVEALMGRLGHNSQKRA